MRPVEEGFRSEGLDLVNGWIDGRIQFDGTQINGRVVVPDFVNTLPEQDRKVGRLRCIDNRRVVVVLLTDNLAK